ncbi:MAG: type secretion system protein PorQ, partial [Bacteroidota bacterium]
MLVVLRVKEFPPFSWGIFISRQACLLLIMSLKAFLGVILVLFTIAGQSQSLGGNSVYNFLKLPMGGQLAALGGKNVSLWSSDLGLVAENPALLKNQHHAFLSSTFNYIAPSVTALQGLGAFHHEKINTSFSIGLVHLLYGEEMQTDASGNILGSFRAFDQIVSASFAKAYGKRWRYGATLKYIYSSYGIYKSAGLAADVGLSYFDENRKLQIGFAARNMGVQLKTYGGVSEDLPLDLVIGVSKQLEKAPLRFSVTVQRLHQFDLLYDDSLYNNESFGTTESAGFVKKLFSHFVFGTELL